MNLSREYEQLSGEPTVGAHAAADDAKASPVVPRTPSAVGQSASGQGAGKIVNSLVSVLRAEAAMLEQGDATVDGSLTRQKLQLMMQLNRIDPVGEHLTESTRETLGEAKRLLDANARILKRRMTAIREIATMISQEISEAQSDGTYEVSVSSREYRNL